MVLPFRRQTASSRLSHPPMPLSSALPSLTGSTAPSNGCSRLGNKLQRLAATAPHVLTILEKWVDEVLEQVG